MERSIEQIARQDGRYDAKALYFVYEGLGKTIQNIREDAACAENRHISGQELANGLGKLAIKRWGKLAGLVLNEWGLHTTRDFGEIVYLMIANKWMRSQETDQIEDFDNVFNFEAMFETRFNFEMS
jgi:uncharacterized repeat protein (TIGR04138 family)